jgi:hypothetical protein
MVNQFTYAKEQRALVAELEAEGLTTSDAQGCAHAELFKKYGVTEMQVIRLSPQGWLNVNDLLESEAK